MNRLRKLSLDECFDPGDIHSRPTKQQMEVINDFKTIRHQYVTAGNQSGKSTIGARLTAWLFAEKFPNWQRPQRWGTEPLLLLVSGRTTKQVEETLWRKIRSYLDEGSYHETRVGNVLQKVTHKETGNTILFFSHHSEREARDKIQSFVAHFAWLDELPASMKLIEEMHRRVQAKQGNFLSTFTPKAVNAEIRRNVDAASPPNSRKYKFSMFDNPIYTADDKKRIISSLEGFSEAYRNCILYGDWLTGESAVYYFDEEKMVQPPPTTYSPAWRHVEASDPALQSAHGLVLAAEDPSTGWWYIIKAEYLKEIYFPEKLLETVNAKVKGVNLVRRISDGHETWYINTASAHGIHYVSPYKKNDRKSELIKNLQEALGKRVFIAPWCTDFIDEITSCHWSDNADGKIAKASRFHILDAAQYLVDCLPKSEFVAAPKTWEEELRMGHKKRKEAESKKAKLKDSPAWSPRRSVEGVWRFRSRVRRVG